MPSNTNVLDPSAGLSLVPSGSTSTANGGLTTDLTPQFLNSSSSIAPTGTVSYLSDLNSTSATNGWGVFEKDKSNGEQGATDGKTLTLNGVTYAKGLGVHAGSEIVYNLGGKYTKFSSNIGVDDEVGNAGSVVFQVFVDGIQLFTSSKMTGATATQLVNLDVIGKQSLKLIVTNSGDGNSFDHADWADAKLTSGGTPLDTTAPTATLTATALNSTRTTPYVFTVTYADATAVNLSTINGTTAASDIQVTGVHGFSQLATLVGVPTPNVNSSSLTATYQITAPDGVWDVNDNSTYTATLLAGQVSDTLGNATASNIILGTFQVLVPTGNPTGTVSYLSDLNSTSATNGWGVFEKDKSNGEQGATDGKTLTLNGVTYAKGLGVHAGSEIVYNLGGKYTKFSSNIGVDDEVGNAGSVVFQVFVDGIQLFTSSKMTGATATQLVNLDVIGKQSLKLIVTNSGDGNSFDHADWADAKLTSGGTLPAPAPLPVANSQPVVTVPGSLAIASGNPLSVSGIKVADADAGNGVLTTTLSTVNGSLAIANNISNGVTATNIKNNGTGTVTLTGTLQQINNTLAAANGVLYTGKTGFIGNDTINVTVNDNGNSGTGGAKTDSKPFSVNIFAAPAPTGTRSHVGTNLAGIADWSTEIPFVDMFKTSREWISQSQGAKWGEGGKLNLTPEGWIASLAPGQFAETVMMTGKTFPAGRYTLLYDGEGKLDFTFNNAKIVSQSPGKMTVDVTPDDAGVFLRLSETNPSNPVRNIRFIMPGFENTYQTQPFNPVFLDRLSKFDTLRFMDWEATNNSTLTNWSDRSTTTSATQATSKGVALEYLIQLANTLKIDPWFTVPAQASDDYVRNFATMVRDRLDPTLKAHVEYSNEAWNGIFTQSNYVGQQGLARGLDNTSWGAGLRYYSERSVEIFKIWENVFGASTSQRVERAFAGQAANPWVGEQILGWKDAYKHADAYAIAPYFDGFDADGNGSSDINDVSRVNITINMTADQIIDGILREIPTEIKAMFDNNAAVAKRFGIDLVSYEGGAHLTSYQFPDDKVAKMTDLFTQVNRNPRMRDVYKAYLDQWQASGGSDFNQFNDVTAPSKWGFWGALEYQNQNPSTAPKYLGLMDFINANP